MENTFDPLLIEVVKNNFAAINDEMSNVVVQTARSVFAKNFDCATAICDSHGRFIGEGAAGFQMGTFGVTMSHLLEKYGTTLKAGDVILVNDPYAGAGHMPDVAVYAPVFWNGEAVAFVMAYSHHTDIGGRFASGFSTLCSESYEEGLRLPLVKVYEQGKRNVALTDTILANVRGNEEWIGDLEAKIAGLRRGEQEIQILLKKYGLETYRASCDYLQDYAERATRAAIRRIPDGEYVAEDTFEEDGLGTPGVLLPLKVALRVEGDSMTVDFTGTGPQVKSALNIPLGNTLGGVYGVMKILVGPDVLTNSGFMRPFKIVAPKGTLVNPSFPAATGARSALIARVFDLLFRALAKAVPDRIPVTAVGADLLHYTWQNPDGSSGALMDPFFGGWGARPQRDGIDGVAPLMFGARGVIQAEIMERDQPIVIEGFGLVPDTEGPGKYRGSLAVYRNWQFTKPGKVIIRSHRSQRPCDGLGGGLPGALAGNVFESGGQRTALPAETLQVIEVKPGDRLLHVTAGMGGYGDPKQRSRELLMEDVKQGKISADRAGKFYGLNE